MNAQIRSFGLAALALAASTAASAAAHVDVDINPFGWGAPPPVVYAPRRYYAPPAVYYGRGHWGDHHDARRHYDRHDDHRR